MSEQQVNVTLTAKEMKKLKKISRPFWKKKRFIFPALLVVIVIIAASTSGGSSSKSLASNPSSTTSASSDSASTVHKVGETFKVGQFQYTVNSVKTSQTVGDTANGLGEKANGLYYIVNITTKNLDNTASTVDTNMFNIVEGNNKYSASSTAIIYVNDANNSMFLTQVNPNVSMSGNIVFDVPANLKKGLQLELSGGILSSETVNVQIN